MDLALSTFRSLNDVFVERERKLQNCKLSWHWGVRSWPFIWNVRTVIRARHYVAFTASCDSRAAWQDLHNWSSSADWPMWHCGLKCSSYVCLLRLCISTEQHRPEGDWFSNTTLRVEKNKYLLESLLKEAHWKPQQRHKYFSQLVSARPGQVPSKSTASPGYGCCQVWSS